MAENTNDRACVKFDLWERKLLDLSTRNSLLNLKITRNTALSHVRVPTRRLKKLKKLIPSRIQRLLSLSPMLIITKSRPKISSRLPKP